MTDKEKIKFTNDLYKRSCEYRLRDKKFTYELNKLNYDIFVGAIINSNMDERQKNLILSNFNTTYIELIKQKSLLEIIKDKYFKN